MLNLLCRHLTGQDLKDIGGNVAKDEIRKSDQFINGAWMNACGLPCDNFSDNNIKQAEFALAVKDGLGVSGGAAASHRKHVKQHPYAICLYENVPCCCV